MNTRRVITSIEELITIVSKSKKVRILNIKDLLITFPFNESCLYRLLGIKEKNSKIKKQIIFDNVELYSLKISDIKFAKRFIIRSSTIKEMWVNNCKFYNSFSIINYCVDTIDSIKIKNSFFVKDACVLLSGRTTIDNFGVEDTHFERDVCVSGLMMCKREGNFFYIAERTKIKGSLKIYNCTLFGNAGISCTIRNNLFLEDVNYKVLKEISKHLLVGHLDISNSRIGGMLSLKRCAFDIVEISDSVVYDCNEQEFYYNILLKDSARVFSSSPTIISDPVKREKYLAELYDIKLKENIKLSLQSIIDRIDNKNLKKYKLKLRIKPKFWKRIFRNLKIFLLSLVTSLGSSERFILFLNKYSNNFNRSWFRGVVFTNVVTIIFFFLINYFGTKEPFFVINWTLAGFGDVIQEYIGLLDIFDLTNRRSGLSLNTVGVLLLFLARIFIAYGCWQTIYAFYKYNKN